MAGPTPEQLAAERDRNRRYAFSKRNRQLLRIVWIAERLRKLAQAFKDEHADCECVGCRLISTEYREDLASDYACYDTSGMAWFLEHAFGISDGTTIPLSRAALEKFRDKADRRRNQKLLDDLSGTSAKTGPPGSHSRPTWPRSSPGNGTP